jgi:hypothetical protein
VSGLYSAEPTWMYSRRVLESQPAFFPGDKSKIVPIVKRNPARTG